MVMGQMEMISCRSGNISKKKIPNIEFISPNAFDKCEMNPFGYQWFHMDEDRRYIFDQNIQNVTDRVFNEYIKKEVEKRSLDISDVILCGFSQGGMISMAVGLLFAYWNYFIH